ELGVGGAERARAGQRVKVGVAELEGDGPRLDAALAGPPADALAEPAQDRLERRGIADVLAERPLVRDAADGLAFRILLRERRPLAPETPAAAALHAPLDHRGPGAEDLPELVERRVRHRAEGLVARRAQAALGDRADAGEDPHGERLHHRPFDARRDEHDPAR